MLLGAVMCIVPLVVDVWLDRHTNYMVGGEMDSHLLVWMTLAAIVGAIIGGFFGLFIGVVIGVFEMQTAQAVAVGIIAGILALLISGGAREGAWGVVAALTIPGGGLIGFCSNGWATRRPVPRSTMPDDEPPSGSIFNLRDDAPPDSSTSKERQ